MSKLTAPSFERRRLSHAGDGDESIAYRSETSRSLEDAEKYRAIETLKEIGLLIPMSELETYHGRADGGEAFKVDPYFKNGGNDSGNFNVNRRSTLYTSDRSTAQEFGDRRAHFDSAKRGEVHEIVARNPDAVVLNILFRASEMSDDERAKFKSAMAALQLPPLEAAPLAFDHRDASSKLFGKEAMSFLADKPLLTKEDIHDISLQLGVHEAAAKEAYGALNASTLTSLNPLFMVNRLLELPGGVKEGVVDTPRHKDALVNFEYVESWLKNINCVGVQQSIRSATVGRNIKSISLFDLRGVNTKQEVDRLREKTGSTLGSLALSDWKISGFEQHDPSSLLGLLDNAHIQPRKLIQAAKKIGNYKAVFEADAGNWEGYSLQEHTETVLRNFDNNFADRVPADMLKSFRLAILAHDIGKPIAARNREKHRQGEYNAKYGKDFLLQTGVDERMANLLVAAGGRGAELAFAARRSKSLDDKVALLAFSASVLKHFYDGKVPAIEQTRGFAQMCNIVNICDGGAYTSQATTRVPRSKIHYRNAGSFDGSFMHPVGLGNTDIVPKK